jgi:hypothetical protein
MSNPIICAYAVADESGARVTEIRLHPNQEARDRWRATPFWEMPSPPKEKPTAWVDLPVTAESLTNERGRAMIANRIAVMLTRHLRERFPSAKIEAADVNLEAMIRE